MTLRQARASGLGSRLVEGAAAGLVGAVIRAVYARQEPELAMLRTFVPTGGTAVDVGAWLGPWTARLRRRADRVVAVEPMPRLAAGLRRAFPDVEVVQAAASDRSGEAVLHVPAGGPVTGMSSLEPGTGVDVPVRSVRLDDLALTDVSFIKLDVEGHEVPALRGAEATIRRDRPVLLIELEERIQPVRPVVDLLAQWGYTAFVLPGRHWVPLADVDLGALQRAGIARVSQSFARKVVSSRPRYVNMVLFRPTAGSA